MSIDLSEFKTKRRRLCPVGRFAEKLSESDREKLEAALDETDITTANICRWMLDRDFGSTYNVLKVHRRKECACHLT